MKKKKLPKESLSYKLINKMNTAVINKCDKKIAKLQESRKKALELIKETSVDMPRLNNWSCNTLDKIDAEISYYKEQKKIAVDRIAEIETLYPEETK